MFPLVSALALALLSFLASVFVILRVIIPVLPPHPLSKRVSPAEFGLPSFRTLSPADKVHVWLASLDIVALTIFIWQVISEATGGVSGFAIASDPASSVRMWTILTIRQTILLVVVGLTLLHLRLGYPISFGRKHWVLWVPALVLVVTSTALSAVVSSTGVSNLFYGLIAYTSTVAAVTLAAFSCIIGTLFIIRRNLNDIKDPRPAARQSAEKFSPSFATEDIEALCEGGSWISSNSSTGSRHNSISAWSFSAHHIANASTQSIVRLQSGRHNSSPVKSAYWFRAASREDIPRVPPLLSPYSQASSSLADPDPFRKNAPRPRMGSQTSWLTSTNGSHTSMSAWSFPATENELSIYAPRVLDCRTPSTSVSRSGTPALRGAQVLGGYGHGTNEVRKGVSHSSGAFNTTVDVSLIRNLAWFLLVLVPYAFAFPYLVIVSQNRPSPMLDSILFALSVTLSSPILALSILFKCSFPVPTGLFESSSPLPVGLCPPRPCLAPPPRRPYEPKKNMSASVAVAEGCRSGDVWIAKGDAVDGKGNIDRAIEVLNPRPKLTVLPLKKCTKEPLTPPLPMQDQFSLPTEAFNTPERAQAQVNRKRTESKASSHSSGVEENLDITSKIMIARRHYSALAQTVVVPSPSPEKEEATKATGTTTKRASSHLRSRSVTSVEGPWSPTPADSFRISPTPPPPFPLPPTPPSVRAARFALSNKTSFSSGFNFSQTEAIAEIDVLTTGVVPILVSRLTIGDDMKAVDDNYSPPDSYGKSDGMKVLKNMNSFGIDFSSPQYSSTPLSKPRNKKQYEHRRNRYSLPSCSSPPPAWSATRTAIDNKAAKYRCHTIPSNVEAEWRNTVFSAETIPNAVPYLQDQEASDVHLRVNYNKADLSRAVLSHTLRVDGPKELDLARLSLLGSAASTVTLFDDIEADFATGPLAESTPHNTITLKKARKLPPPLPLGKYTISHRRSYIKFKGSANDIANATPPNTESVTISAINVTPPDVEEFTTVSTMALLLGAVKPIVPKANILQCNISSTSSIITGSKAGSIKAGLRPLRLLQDRDTNTTAGPIVLRKTRLLTLEKKQKTHQAAQKSRDENADQNSILRSHNSSKKLKLLKLARSETSKMRGTLR